MQYKTIALHLLEDRPDFYDQLRSQRMVLATLERYAREMKTSHQGPRAVLNAVERLANGYGSSCESVRKDLAIAESQFRDYQARMGNPFAHDAYLSQLTGLRDQLKTGLSSANPQPNADAQPTVSELSEQIKSLKAENAIEATPERVGKRRSAAEEPVTARLRGKAEVVQIPETPKSLPVIPRVQSYQPAYSR